VKCRRTLSRGGDFTVMNLRRGSSRWSANQRPYWPTLFNFTVVFGLFWIV
jgi:hypothetical protein